MERTIRQPLPLEGRASPREEARWRQGVDEALNFSLKRDMEIVTTGATATNGWYPGIPGTVQAIPDNATWDCTFDVRARSETSASAGWKIWGRKATYYRERGADAIKMGATVALYTEELDASSWTVTDAVSGKAPLLTITGAVSVQIRWKIHVEVREVFAR